jgi:hypothetical protein
VVFVGLFVAKAYFLAKMFNNGQEPPLNKLEKSHVDHFKVSKIGGCQKRVQVVRVCPIPKGLGPCLLIIL